jgi:ribose/xylose/arabinose/galactoside ABC-type transport system permease subunit
VERTVGAPSLLTRFGRALNQYAGVLVVLVATILVLGVANDRFLTPGNIVNILETNAVLLVVAVGLTFVLLVGGIDLSLGARWPCPRSGCGRSSPPACRPRWRRWSSWSRPSRWGRPSTACSSAGSGCLLVVTIGTASLYRGLALVSTDGGSESLFTVEWLNQLGSGRFLGVPLLVLISLAVLVAGILVLRYTDYGRMVYAVGGNPEAARLAGMPVVTVRV